MHELCRVRPPEPWSCLAAHAAAHAPQRSMGKASAMGICTAEEMRDVGILRHSVLDCVSSCACVVRCNQSPSSRLQVTSA